jgi:hypothetical protein
MHREQSLTMPASEFLTLADISVARKRVLVRVDFNVPLKDGQVADDTRIRASLRTIYQLLEGGAAVMLMSHLGRPREGEFDPQFSLKPVAQKLETLLDRPVPLVRDWLDGVDVAPGEVVMLENVRFQKGEKANADDLARRMAALCDLRRGQVRGQCLRGTAAGSRDRGAGPGDRGSGAAHGGGRWRRQDFHQAVHPGAAPVQGGPPDTRRRHRQHVSQGRRQRGRKVAA